MRTLKHAYMLRSKAKPGRYLLREMDSCWFPMQLSSSERIETGGQQFICETDRRKAEAIAEEWNGKNAEQVEVVEVLRGFVPARKKPKDEPPCARDYPNDLVWRRDVYGIIFKTGGTGSEQGTWEKGWDDAVDSMETQIGEMKGADAT